MLYILTPLFCVALLCGTVFSFSKTGDKVYAASAVKASAAYLDLDGSGNILNGFEGGQKENVYFGTNSDSPIKWRVLKKNDTKYGSGNNLLLWTDKYISKEIYNTDQENLNFGFWGTSYMRANLNGGSYYDSSYSAVSTGTSSWYSRLFTGLEQGSIVPTGSYTTDNYGVGFVVNTIIKSPITSSTDGADGKYNTNTINGSNRLPMARYATVSNSGVRETTSGDKLFLIDYYDINNVDYGFGDNGLTYAKKINSSWTESSNWFPGYYDNDNNGSIKSNYLNFYYPSGDSDACLWLRNAGRNYTYGSGALVVTESAIIYGGVSSEYYVSPATVLNTDNIAYATTAKPTGSWANMSNVSAKPEYRLYLKTSDYTAHTANAKATVGESGGTLNIRYNNPTGVSGGNLLVLLSSKTATGGEVAYQTAISMNSTSATDNVTATVALPAGVSLTTHNVSMLYTTNNGGNSTETAYCAYDTESGLEAPGNITATYNGQSKWLTGLTTSEKPAWLDLDIYDNAAFMSVKSVEYTDTLGSAVKTVTTADIKSAGTYKVTMSIADGLKWSTGDITDKSFKITVNKADPAVTASQGWTGNPYVTDGLPVNSDGTAKVTNSASGGTPGTFSWVAGQTPSASTTSYRCMFTPTDKNNFNTKECNVNVTFTEDDVTGVTATLADGEYGAGTGKLYTAYSLDKLKVSPWNLKVKLIYESGREIETADYSLNVLKDGAKLNNFHAGTNTVLVESNGFDYRFTVEVIAAEIDSIKDVTFAQNGEKIYPDTLLDDIKKLFTVRGYWNYNTTKFETLDKDTFKLAGTLVAGTGTSTLSIVYIKGGSEQTYEIPAGVLNQLKVDYHTYDMSGISLSGELNPVYNGNKHELTLAGKLPDGVTATIKYLKGDIEAEPINAGTYSVVASFTGDSTNYEAIPDKTATLVIGKAAVTGIGFADEVKPEITGTSYTLKATGVPEWITVEYTCGGAEFTEASAAGEYEITATFIINDSDYATNYETPAPKTAKLTISDKPPVEGAGNIVVEPSVTVTYTGSAVDYSAKNVPDGVSVTYEILKDGVAFAGTEIVDAGEYTVTVKFGVGADKMPIADKVCVVTVGKADYPGANGITFEGTSVSVGTSVTVVAENVPEGVTVTYVYDGKEQSDPFVFTALNEDGYTVTAKFTHSNPNYNDIAEKSAVVKIKAAYITGVIAKLEEGATFTADNTLDDLKSKLTAEIEYNNGTKETLKPEDFEVTCNELRENGKFKAGIQSVTVKYGDFTTVVNLTVNKVKVAVPTFKGGLSYTGIAVKPTVENFNGYDADIMTFVTDKTLSGLNAGSYKAVFALNDIENYEWATASAMSKNLYKVSLYDEEIQLVAGETAVDWTLAKAKITATTSEGELPVFASESYKGALSGIVGLKYYKDEGCTEEISSEELGYETTYYVKAELLDGDNFELDTSAAELTVAPVPYTTPAKELTFWEKVVVFLKANWLWLVIAVVALILLITIIALCVRASKKKREREERRLAEEKEERKREQEERRLEREERMARLSQQQAAPQPQYIPQPMPQMMPQMQMPMAQPMAQQGGMAMGGGSVDNAQLARIEAELSALRAEQNSAKEVAALRAEMAAKEATLRAEAAFRAETAMRDDISAMRVGGEQVVQGGISIDKLTELIRTEVNNAFESRGKATAQTAQQTESAPATTQVPPDAVMTTVTTTKIDTTKKPVQNTNDRAPVGRPIVRNYVAPMPVDDGRVFDVGGFYKPADPVTDLGLTDDEDKKD